MTNKKNTRFTIEGTTLTVPLYKTDYTVHCTAHRANKESTDYSLSIGLKRNDIGKIDLIEDQEFKLESSNIYADAANYIMDKHKEHFFKKYIDRYEYYLEMIDKAIAMDEAERLGA